MIEFLDHLDQSVFLFLNGLHNPFMDRLIMIATKGAVWIPLYLLFLYLVIRKYKWNTLLIIIVVTLMILVSDQLSDLIKNSVHRLRPSQQPGLRVHIVDAYKGGTFGFYSAHATNSFSVAPGAIAPLPWQMGNYPGKSKSSPNCAMNAFWGFSTR